VCLLPRREVLLEGSLDGGKDQVSLDPAAVLAAGGGTWSALPNPFSSTAIGLGWYVGRVAYAYVLQIPSCDYYFVRVGSEQDALRPRSHEAPVAFIKRLMTWCETRIKHGCARPLPVPVVQCSQEPEEAPPPTKPTAAKKKKGTGASVTPRVEPPLEPAS
jgi:hypothetical protein